MPHKEDLKLFESLFILYKCNQAVNNLWNKIQNEDESINGLEYSDTPLLYHIILEVVNFKEEYNSYFNSKYLIKYSIRVNNIKDINKPIFKIVNKWNLKDFRNNIIAHTWRKNGKFAHPDSAEYSVPKNALEFRLLINYINYAWSLIETEFKKELDETMRYMLSISEVPDRNVDYSNLNDEQINLVKEVNLKCMKYQKPYFLRVLLFDFPEIEKK